MSEINMKTIESLPLVEKPAEDASIVGWNNGHTVRMPVGAVGGSKGIVFTYSGDSGGGAPMSLEPLAADSGSGLTCNYNFDECWELLISGAPVVFVDTNSHLVSSMMQGEYCEDSGNAESLAPFASTFSAPEGAYIRMSFTTWYGDFYIEYSSNYLNGGYTGGDA